MRMIRLTFLAAITLMLATSCSQLKVISAQQLGDDCSGTPANVRILVNDDGTVDPMYEKVYIRHGTKVTWYLEETGVTKKLDIRLPPAQPPRFIKTRVKPTEITVVRTGVNRVCEGHPYKIKVWINGNPVSVDPILIIRE